MDSYLEKYSVSSLVWFPNPLAAGSGLGERRGQNALFFLWQPISQPKMAQDWKIGHFWNPLCVNFQKMVSEVKKIILQAPRPWNSTPSNLGRFALQFGEVWKVDFSLVFLSDLSHCISLGHLDRVPIWLPAASGVGNQTIFITHWCARHLFLIWHWPKLNCLGQTRQLQIVFFVFWRASALLNHVSKQEGGGEEVFEAYI